jgi:3-deoxy-manno-octulosonate cytidylyltransferase (CMP-KDO synthetase)
MANPIVLIPARMNATRLPGKPLADINGAPMIVHVWRRAMEADIGPVWVAADDPRVMEAVASAGGKAIMTRSDHPSDLPTIETSIVRACLAPLAERAVDIATLATPITREQEKDDPNVVKIVATELDASRLRALYFTRARAPWGEGRLLHHIGLYAYRREALRRFVGLPPSPLEKREKLEQLRALEAGMRIDVAVVDTAPLGVDAPEDLERARAMLAPGKHT